MVHHTIFKMPPKNQSSSKSKGDNPDGRESFEEGLKLAGFTEATAAILQEHGFDSMDSLLLLGRDDKAVHELGLNLQQRLLLNKYLSDRSKGGDSVVDLTEAGTTLQSVLQSHTVGGPQQAREEPDIMNDPQFYLRGGCVTSRKYRDIIDYINLVPPVTEEKVICNDSGVEMVLRSGTKRPPLESVAIEEWCLANSRVMYEMLEQGELDMKSVKDYMGYTVKVCDLFKRFDRVSVLQYDREYRHLQSAFHFRWGVDAPHLHATCLRFKQQSSAPLRAASHKVQRKEVCRLYNSTGGCTYGERCKFIHKCSLQGCNEAHSRAQAHTNSSHTVNPF